MTYESEHARPTTTRNTLVTATDNTTAPLPVATATHNHRHNDHHQHHHLAAPVERRTRTDPRTHAKSVYERDPQGREVYATYYNSNDDPTFQEKYNKNGNAFVTTSHFTFVSNGGAPKAAAAASRVRAPIVEEEAPVEDARPQTGRKHSRTTTANATPTVSAQPIVEEPDDDDGYVKVEHVRRDQQHPHRHQHRHHRPMHDDGFFYDEEDPWGDRALMQLMAPHGFARPRQQPQQQISPFARSGLFSDDDIFFGGAAQNPFRMMDAMHQRMAQQRAAMFGGVDPFANFFF